MNNNETANYPTFKSKEDYKKWLDGLRNETAEKYELLQNQVFDDTVGIDDFSKTLELAKLDWQQSWNKLVSAALYVRKNNLI